MHVLMHPTLKSRHSGPPHPSYHSAPILSFVSRQRESYPFIYSAQCPGLTHVMVCTCQKFFFYGRVVSHCVNIPQLVYPFSCDGYSDCFQFLAIMNKTVLHDFILVHEFMLLVLSGKHLQLELLRG
jgi:hypothetical protein